MQQEVKEELSAPAQDTPATEATSEDAPADTTPESPPEPSPEEAPPEEQAEPQTVVLSKQEYDKIVEERENYKKGLLAEKGRKRLEELSLPGEEEPVEAPLDSTSTVPLGESHVLQDYSSKRADTMAEYRDKFLALSDDEFRSLRAWLGTAEQTLLSQAKAKTRYIARRELTDLIDEGISYVKYKHGKPTTGAAVDTGSLQSIRKVQSKPRVSEEAKRIQPYTKDKKTGAVLPLETIQGMIDRGEL